MLKRLQKKWNVSGWQFIAILCTFAVTGTTTAWLTRMLPDWLGMDKNTHPAWSIFLRVGMLVFGYQVIILIVSVFFGQFQFFWNYEKKILRALRILPTPPTPPTQPPPPTHASYKLAIFASGAGSNAAKIMEYFRQHASIRVALVVSNKPEAGVLNIAREQQLPTLIIEREPFFRGDAYVPALQQAGITHIILAGFLWKVPARLVEAYTGRIVNIHPALLPHYGGKGMYGNHVHEAVIASGEKESGITIHLVDEQYDHGAHLFQARCPVLPDDTPQTLASRIHELEHRHFSGVIENWILGR